MVNNIPGTDFSDIWGQLEEFGSSALDTVSDALHMFLSYAEQVGSWMPEQLLPAFSTFITLAIGGMVIRWLT